MVSKSRALVFIAALAMGAACNRQPLGPSSVAPVQLTEHSLSAKPPGAAPHTVSFSGEIDAAGQPLPGSITGSESAGTLRATVSGTYEWTILSVSSCTEPMTELTSRGLVGSAIKGSLAFDANQRTSSGQRLDFSMTGITRPDGQPLVEGETWAIGANSTINFPAAISGDQSSVTVVMNNMVIGFKKNPRGKVAADLTIGCRVSFTATIAG